MQQISFWACIHLGLRELEIRAATGSLGIDLPNLMMSRRTLRERWVCPSPGHKAESRVAIPGVKGAEKGTEEMLGPNQEASTCSNSSDVQ